MNKKIMLGIAVFVMFAVLVVPGAAQEVYFVPQHSNATYCDTVDVEIWINATNVQSGQINLTYDTGCANVTNFVRNMPFTIGSWDSSVDGREWITFMAEALLTGERKIGTLKIHCVREEERSTTLDFVTTGTEPSALFDDWGNKIPGVTWTDGTFECIVLPDLTVTEIKPNCDYVFANESNNISATIENIGTGDADAFNVSFRIDGFSEEVRISELAVGANTTVTITDTTIRNAGIFVSINVTADCGGEISELNETNNWMNILETVVNNGYKGKRYTGGEDIKTVQTHTLNGNIFYSVGDSYYLSGSKTPWYTYTANWAASDLPVPAGATIEKARLYVYYTWDKVQGMPDNVRLTFNGDLITMDAFYADSKGYGGWDYPSGMLAYDVTGDFNSNGNNVILENLNPVAGNPSIQGMLLMAIYADSNEPKRTIWINEECDILAAKDSYCVNSEEATAFAPFAGAIEDMDNVTKSSLITVAPQADEGDDKNKFYFNDGEWHGIWDGYAGSTQLGINETDVSAYLSSTDNLARFQSNIPTGETKGDYMEASNAILVVEYVAKPDLIVTEIKPNCDYIFANESNEITATIKNNGTAKAGAFSISFCIDEFSEEVRISELAAGANITVSTTDPTIRNAGISVSINVTADCNHEVNESNETNNWMNVSETVMNNGYKGKRYTGGEDITTWQFHDRAHINLTYSTGDSKYQTGYKTLWTTYTADWTANDLPIPSGATIKKAVLYTYYTFDRTPAGDVTDYFTLTFNGNVVPIDQHYSDRKGYGSYNYPYGMVRYNVTDDFIAGGTNNAELNNAEPTTPHHVSLSGMMLMVVYEHVGEPMRMLWINEGFDIISARTTYCVTSEEATAYVPFAGGTIEPDTVDKATLVTVMQDAFDGDDKNRLYFNGGEWHGIWDSAAKQGDTTIAINKTEVLAYLEATDNEARLQSNIPEGETKGDGMGAANAILVVEIATPRVSISTDKTTYSPGDTMHITLNLTNPTIVDQLVLFAWYLEIEDGGLTTIITPTTVILPAGVDYSIPIPMSIGDLGPTDFDAVWSVELLGPVTHEIIDSDTAEWSYVHTVSAIAAEVEITPANIGAEIEKEINKRLKDKEVELPF